MTLYVPVPLIATLQRRLADYPNLLAEGGSNFWDVFQLVPVSESFWHRQLLFNPGQRRNSALSSGMSF